MIKLPCSETGYKRRFTPIQRNCLKLQTAAIWPIADAVFISDLSLLLQEPHAVAANGQEGSLSHVVRVPTK